MDTSKIHNIASSIPTVDPEEQLIKGKPTSSQMVTKAPTNAPTKAPITLSNISTSYITSSIGSSLSSLGNSAMDAGASVVNLASSGLSAFANSAILAGLAEQIGEEILIQTTSYVGYALAEVAGASVSYATKYVTDTASKTTSYVATLTSERMPKLKDFLVPKETTQAIEDAKKKAAEKAAMLAEKANKAQVATQKLNNVTKIVTDYTSYISQFIADGPAMVEDLSKDILSTGFSYVAKVRDEAISGIAEWEEKASTKTAYFAAMKLVEPTIKKTSAELKKAADKISKAVAEAEIKAMAAVSVAISKVCALVGL